LTKEQQRGGTKGAGSTSEREKFFKLAEELKKREKDEPI
jgi:hypothetical protein